MSREAVCEVVRVSQRIERTDHGHGWNPTVHPLVRSTNGDWTITVYLSPGRVIYHFDVDGAFWLDPYETGGSATPARPSIPLDTSPPGVISMAQRKVRGWIVSLTRRGHLATRGRRLPLVPGEFERVVSPNGTRTLGVVRRMAGMLAFVGIASRESRAVANPSAWAIDRHALAVASERGCDVVAILDADSNDTWTCALSQVKQVGVRIDRGSERQWAVPFECWTRLRDHTPFRRGLAQARDQAHPGHLARGTPGRSTGGKLSRMADARPRGLW